jgi:hypothetical protein
LEGESLLHVLVDIKATGVLQTPAMSRLVSFKWERFGRSYFLRELFFYLCFVVVSAVVLLAGVPEEPRCSADGELSDVSHYSARDWIGSRFAYLLVALGSLLHLQQVLAMRLMSVYRQQRRISTKKGCKAFFSAAFNASAVFLFDAFNLSDIACYLLGIAITVARWSCAAGSKRTSQLSAVFLVLLWIKILPFFQVTGALRMRTHALSFHH